MGDIYVRYFITKLCKWLPHNLRRFLYSYFRADAFNDLVNHRNPHSKVDYAFPEFDQYRCIFIHNPRTGGNSIVQSLFGGHSPGHRTAKQYQLAFTKQEFDQYFKFTFVRNPWDRFISAFHFLKQGGMNLKDALWAERLHEVYFDEFVEDYLDPDLLNQVHFRPQSYFICGFRGKPVVDFTGRFEHFDEDFASVADRLGLDNKPLHVNTSRHNYYRDYYTDKLQKKVAAYYDEDITLFRYEF